MKPNNLLVIITLMLPLTCGLTGCAFKKAAPASQQSSSVQLPRIEEQDWDVSEVQIRPGIDRTKRTLKAEKLSIIQRAFRVPSNRPITLPEAHGFELYEFGGVTELEDKTFILPKLFVSATADQGSILGYYEAGRNSDGQKVVTLSVPVALINGREAAIAVSGAGVSNSLAARMPGEYVIPNIEALQRAIAPKTLDTLAVCPKAFKLRFHGREYFGDSPFERGSLCPINQFFRVKFSAAEEEVSELLEQAALQEGSVELTADLSADFIVPRLVNQISVSPQVFSTAFQAQLVQQSAIRGQYRVQDIEAAFERAVWMLMREGDSDPTYPIGLSSLISTVTDQMFSRPSICADRQGVCRTLRVGVLPNENVRLTWIGFEALTAGIRTQAFSVLGAGANGRAFLSQPSPTVLAQMSRPSWWSNLNNSQLVNACSMFVATCSGVILPADRAFCNPTGNAENSQVGVSFCQQFLAQSQIASMSNDGYSPLGTGTVVYPGSLVRIDFDRIAELTRSRFRPDENGRQTVVSELVDQILQSGGERTTCAQGTGTACLEYQTIRKEERDSHGDFVYGDSVSCSEGSPGCTCTGDGTARVCTRRGEIRYVTQRTFQCNSEDQEIYCPYHRVEREKVGENVEYECKDDTTTESAFILFSSTSHRLVCREKQRTVISEDRAHPYCRGFDPRDPNLGLPPEVNCKRPRYVCNRWASNCSQYSLNEDYNLLHDNPDPRWRDYSIEAGEWPARFRDQLYLRFVSPKGVATNCRIDRFPRFFRGKTMFLKIPRPGRDDNVCGTDGGEPIWNSENITPEYWPELQIKNEIAFPQARKCGRTQYRFVTRSIPMHFTPGEIPTGFSLQPEVAFGPVPGSCFAPNAYLSSSGMEYMFNEISPVRVSGRVTVLGRVLQAIATPGASQSEAQ